jgi:hypothetical protein
MIIFKGPEEKSRNTTASEASSQDTNNSVATAASMRMYEL